MQFRGGKASHKRPSRSPVVRDRAAYTPYAKNPGERLVADLLRIEGLKYDYEPQEFSLELTGKGKSAIKPDFYVRKFHVFLEVTQGNDLNMGFKRSKIRNAHALYPEATIILVGPDELAELDSGQVMIIDLIEQGIEDREAPHGCTNVA